MTPPLSAISEVMRMPYLGFHTAKRMQPRQIAGIAERKSRELLLPHLPVDFDRRYHRRVPDDPPVRLESVARNTELLRKCIDDTTRERYRTRAREAAGGAPTFMNRTLRVAEGVDVEWYDDRFEALPLLWPLKLYAFQPISWLYLGFDPRENAAEEFRATFDGWIEDWIESVEIGRPGYLRRAWTPWAVSLRIVYWSRYLAWRDAVSSDGSGGDFERAFRRELYKNALFLRNHVETDVGGNHLIENGAALIVAGVLFSKRSWIKGGTSILTDAATTQFLEDGYHFERSPMYHVLTLTRYLTVCDLLDRGEQSVPGELRTTADKATAFLRFLRPPNGRIPLLNDAVYGQALPLEDCLQYADAIGFENEGGVERWAPPARTESIKRTSGYRWLRTDDGAMLIDGGLVGPPHLPGHSHSDTLSVLLWLDDRPVMTDTGTFGYVAGSRREYARGVRGHNTVQVGDTEPITLGGTYLMGPRPEPTTRHERGIVSLFEGRYEAMPYDRAAYTHHRAAYAGDKWWVIRDAVSGQENRPTCSQLHLHPDVDPSIDSTGRVRLELGGGDGVAFVYPLEATRVSINAGWRFPRFGVSDSRPVIQLYAKDTKVDPMTLGFLITRHNIDDIAVKSTDIGLTHLHVAAEEYRLPEVRFSTGKAEEEAMRPSEWF